MQATNACETAPLGPFTTKRGAQPVSIAWDNIQEIRHL